MASLLIVEGGTDGLTDGTLVSSGTQLQPLNLSAFSPSYVTMHARVDTAGYEVVGAEFTIPAELELSFDGGASWKSSADSPYTAPTIGDTNFPIRVRQPSVAGATTTFSTDNGTYRDAYAALVQGETSLVAYWRMDETSGTTAEDSEGTYDGTHTSGPTVNESPAISLGKSVRYTRADSEYTTVADAAALKGLTEFTFEAWVKFASLPANGELYTILGKVGSYYWTFYNAAGIYEFFATANYTDATIEKAWTPSVDTWYHVAMTWKDSTNEVKLFVNGVQQGTTGTQASATPAGTTDPLTIGRFNATHHMNGWLDEVAIYNTALSASTLLSHYNAR